MKKRSLLLLTVFTILCTGLGMTGAGWFSATSSGRQGARHADPRSHAKAQVPAITEAAWRYRRSQPVHWRAMMLQH